jgi:hypothetical protein
MLVLKVLRVDKVLLVLLVLKVFKDPPGQLTLWQKLG